MSELPNGLPSNYLGLPQEERNRLFVEMYEREKKAAPEKFKPYHTPAREPEPERVPYPSVWFGEMAHPAGPHYFSRKQESWLRWRDAEEKRRGCPGPWRRK